jgi:hypothetical protein
MIPSVFLLILTVNIVDIDCTQVISYIYNASYVSVNSSVIITYTNECSECICQGLFANASPAYIGLNCYNNNNTCALFTDYSSSTAIKINLNSIFIFIEQSTLQNTTTREVLSIKQQSM